MFNLLALVVRTASGALIRRSDILSPETAVTALVLAISLAIAAVASVRKLAAKN